MSGRRSGAGQAPVTYFPTRTTPAVRGEKKIAFSFRVPEALGKYVQDVRSRGYSLAEVMVEIISFARDVMAETDGVVRLLQHEADKRSISLGTVIGQLAAEKIRELYELQDRNKKK